MNKVVDHKCPACAAVLTFKPEVKGWQCEYCDNKYTEADLAKVELEDDNNDDYINYKCQNCGAEIITDTETSSTFCIYCGNTAIMKNKITGKFRPSRLIPFKKTKEDAVQAFVNLKKGRPLMPRSFISENNVKKISGVYIPFWLHTVAVDGNIVVNAKNVPFHST